LSYLQIPILQFSIFEVHTSRGEIMLAMEQVDFYRDNGYYLILFVFPISFAGIWVAVCFLLANIGGWSRLGKHYRSQNGFAGKKWLFESGWFPPVNYKRCLTIGSDEYGLYLAVLPLFRVGHPPLFISWSDITTTESQGWLFSYREFTFSKDPTVKLRVLRDVGEKILTFPSRVEG
jgi:hypothetical protein